MSLLQVFRYTYHQYLPIVAFPTTLTSFYVGVFNELNSSEIVSPMKQFSNIFSIMSLGVMVSVSYPISIPVCGFTYAYVKLKTVK